MSPEPSNKIPATSLDELSINALRFLSVDAVQKANSGHPGLPLGAAAMAYVLWTRFLKHHPANPGWFDRDRFVLSAGHGSMLLYSLLHVTGYALPLEQIKQFRQWGSMTPGHPERGLTPGVETTTGPLGQGFGNGVGMAMAEAHLAGRYNRPGFKVVDHHTYGIVPALLSAEITARMGRDPGEIYRELAREFGEPVSDRVEAPATPKQKQALARLSPQQIRSAELAGEKIQSILTRAPGNDAPIGGLKVVAESGWFAARPSGTEDIYKIYAESFRGADHLRRILEEAQAIVAAALNGQ